MEVDTEIYHSKYFIYSKTGLGNACISNVENNYRNIFPLLGEGHQ